ncbi:MAG: hypothetical protein ACOZIN_05540 [Myxococcota bacterium]
MTSTLAAASSSAMATGPFSHPRYTIKRPFFTLLGRKFYVYGADGSLALFVRHKLFALRDEWNLYSDESEARPLIQVRARQVIGINIISDVFDAQSGQKLGTVRNKGLKSIVRDTWETLDEKDQPQGSFTEDSSALLRRFLPLLPGHWHLEVGGEVVAKLDQVFRFFVKEFTLDLSLSQGRVDPRFALACAMLALMREVARESRG